MVSSTVNTFGNPIPRCKHAGHQACKETAYGKKPAGCGIRIQYAFKYSGKNVSDNDAKGLYQWQEECLTRWLEAGGRGTVQAVTGSGKTKLALHAIHALEQELGRSVQVKIVVPTGALMRQWAKALREDLESRATESPSHMCSESVRNQIGLRGDGRRDPADRRYMIYVINSARYELARQILMQLEQGEAVFLIADECHHYTSGENSLIFEFLTRIHREEAAYYSLGLSATLPSGDAGRMLTKVIGPCVYSYGMAKAAELETVCPFDIFHISLSFQESEQDEYDELTGEMTYCFTRLRKAVPSIAKTGQKERFEELKRLSAGADKRLAKLARTYMNLTYKRKSLVCMASARVSCAEKLISLFNSQEKILIFGERIAQAEELYRILARRYPGRVGRCHSKIGELANRNNLERFRTGEYRILITCRALDEGVDIPDASTGIILSGTSAHRQRVQRLGRIIRKNEGKERAALYYLHMEKTAEDACYLPDFQGNRVYELFYDSKKNNFLNPPYMAAARQVLEDFRRKGVNENTFREICRCLDKGCVRGDWTSAAELLDRRADEARGTAERNYWICMKKVREKV